MFTADLPLTVTHANIILATRDHYKCKWLHLVATLWLLTQPHQCPTMYLETKAISQLLLRSNHNAHTKTAVCMTNVWPTSWTNNGALIRCSGTRDKGYKSGTVSEILGQLELIR